MIKCLEMKFWIEHETTFLHILYKNKNFESYNWLSDLISYRVVTRQTYITSKQNHKIPEIKGNGRNGSLMEYERGMKARNEKVNIMYTDCKTTQTSILLMASDILFIMIYKL